MAIVTVARREMKDSDWDAFVDAHPAGWFWHRHEWIDYCLDFDPTAVDESFALVSTEPSTFSMLNRIVALCPAIKCNNEIRMGDDPCAGALTDSAYHADLLRAIQNRFVGCNCAWRWNQHPSDSRELIDALSLDSGLVHSAWMTAVVDLSNPNRWNDVRKSYRSLINKAQREVDLESGSAYWEHYESCHKQTATRPRPEATYRHQQQWVKDGFAQVYVACGKGHRTKADVPLSASLVIEYKGRGYYASGTSRERNLQHALQWLAMESLAKRNGLTYELGWVNRYGAEDQIGFFKRGLGGDLYVVDAIAGVLK